MHQVNGAFQQMLPPSLLQQRSRGDMCWTEQHFVMFADFLAILSAICQPTAVHATDVSDQHATPVLVWVPSWHREECICRFATHCMPSNT